MGSTFIINITKGFLENKVETLVYIVLILSQCILTDVLREEATQNTEIEKI